MLSRGKEERPPASALCGFKLSAFDLVAIRFCHGEEALTLASVLALAFVSGCLACGLAFTPIRTDTVAFAFLCSMSRWRESARENQCRGSSGD
jgi:hypothetical protein